jgi:hypothetical protein
MVGNLVDFRIAFAVAPDVRQTIRRFWVRPKNTAPGSCNHVCRHSAGVTALPTIEKRSVGQSLSGRRAQAGDRGAARVLSPSPNASPDCFQLRRIKQENSRSRQRHLFLTVSADRARVSSAQGPRQPKAPRTSHNDPKVSVRFVMSVERNACRTGFNVVQ